MLSHGKDYHSEVDVRGEKRTGNFGNWGGRSKDRFESPKALLSNNEDSPRFQLPQNRIGHLLVYRNALRLNKLDGFRSDPDLKPYHVGRECPWGSCPYHKMGVLLVF